MLLASGNIAGNSPGVSNTRDHDCTYRVAGCGCKIRSLWQYLGSAEPWWLYVLDADWSDLIEISDVTRTVYISFDPQLQERPQVANVFNLRNVFLCSHFVIIPPIITVEKFEGGQIALSLIRYC